MITKAALASSKEVAKVVDLSNMSLVVGGRDVSEGLTVGCQGSDAPPPSTFSNATTCISMSLKLPPHIHHFITAEPPSPTASSSIGAASKSSSLTGADRGDESSEVEAQSRFKGGSLDSFASLESSLPVKRGLSNFFNGKSKSFASLCDASAVSDLAKPENRFNKRRRIIVAYKRAGRSPLTTSASLSLLSPEFTLDEEREREGDREVNEGAEEEREQKQRVEKEEDDPMKKANLMCPLPLHRRKFKSFKGPRSFSLTDLSDV